MKKKRKKSFTHYENLKYNYIFAILIIRTTHHSFFLPNNCFMRLRISLLFYNNNQGYLPWAAKLCSGINCGYFFPL